MKIIIDPGHGGKDSGGGSNTYWKEKDMNLKISLYQYRLFQQIGIDVGLTRSKDRYLGATERAEIVRDSGVEICLSNHINYYNSSSVEGAEVIHSIHSDGKLAELILNALVDEGAKWRRVFSKEHPSKPGSDYYYMNRETGAVQTVIIEYGFASNPRDTERIRENWQSYAEAVVRATADYMGYSYDEGSFRTKIVGETATTLPQMEAWAKARGATQKFIEAAEKYMKYGQLTGIRPEVLYAQSAKETGFGHYTGAVKEEMNNFAGIKMKNPIGDRTEDFECFSTVDAGVRAHFNHMAAYVGLEPIGKAHDRYFVVKSLSWAGTIKYVQDLGGKWAIGTDYGVSIVENYLEGLLESEVETLDYKTLYENSQKEIDMLNQVIIDLRNKLDAIKDILEAE